MESFIGGKKGNHPHVQDNLFADGINRQNRIAVGHLSIKGGKFENPAFGPSGNLTKCNVRVTPVKNSVPQDEAKRDKLQDINYESVTIHERDKEKFTDSWRTKERGTGDAAGVRTGDFMLKDQN